MRSVSKSPLTKILLKFIYVIGEFVPSWIGTKALTFFSLLSAILVFVSYFMSQYSRALFLLASLFIFFQWIFDCLDGHIGRKRKEGFVRWGYYMDHLFDYFFLASIIGGFYVLSPNPNVVFLFFLSSLIMLNIFLMHGATADVNKNIVVSFMGISPEEVRLLVMILNVVLFFKPELISLVMNELLFCFNIFLSVLLLVLIFMNQKRLNKLDTKND